jgi:cytochrome c553
MGLFMSASVLAAPPKIVAVCAECHGVDGNSTVATNPKLAGQQKEYLAKQLNNMMSVKRKNERMTPHLAAIKADEIPVLVEYFSSQKTAPGTVHDAKLAEEGKKIFLEGIVASDVPACASCHQADAKGKGIYPTLAGQHADYLFLQLKNFSTADRSNDPNKFMRTVAKHMNTNEKDMRAVAEYLSGL